MTTRRRAAALAGLVLAAVVAHPVAGSPQEPAREDPAAAGRFSPTSTPIGLGAAAFAKILCSAVFVSGRAEDEAARNSAYFLTPEADRTHLTTVVDRERKVVRVTVRDAVTRSAGYYGDQGCVIHPEGTESVFFTPMPVTSALPDAHSMAWPMGDAEGDTPWPRDVDRARLDEAVAVAFADPAALTAGMLVLHKGRIVAERYGAGITADTLLESWSMGKSLTATLVGLLIQDGAFTLDDPAPVAEWRQQGDPRGGIRISDLLRMSSGLHCVAPGDPDYTEDKGYPAHVLVYTGAIDVFRFSMSRPLQFRPNSEGRYRNCDPLTLGGIVRQTVEGRGETYLTWPQRALFDRLGIRRQVLEPDPYGNFVLSGYDYGTLRNWARLGLLYAQDGTWQGERLLPEGFVDFVSTPAPAWPRRDYGGLFWINGAGDVPAPADTYWMAGAGGQRVVIVPSHELVIVRMGHMRGDTVGMRLLNEAIRGIIDAVPAARLQADR